MNIRIYIQRVIITAIILLFNRTTLFAQTESNTLLFNGNSYYSFIIKLDKNTHAKFQILENNNFIPHRQLLDSINTENVFIATASIVDTMCHPLGYYVSNKVQIQGLNSNNGLGNFYLKPNGAFLVTNNSVIICSSDEIANYSNIIYGIQSGPMLIVNDTINSRFGVNSNNKHIRSGVGTFQNSKGESFIVFSISKEDVSFYYFASFLHTEFRCSNALCLESARSVMAIPFLPNDYDESESIICRYIVFINE